MMYKNIAYFACMITLLLATTATSYAQPMTSADLGQTIQIYTRLNSYIGRPQWLLIIRDIDHNQNLPYLFEVNGRDNFWIAYTYGRNYMITASNLQFSPYRANPYRSKAIKNFCNLESNGHVLRGESMHITITGDLSANTDSYQCNVIKYTDANFTVVNQPAAE